MSVLEIPRPDAIIFDMDGLLLDSERVAQALLEQAAAELNLRWEREAGLRMIGLRRQDSNQVLLEAFGDDYPVDILRERFDVLYEKAITDNAIPLKPYAYELLERLQSRRIPCAVATSTRRQSALLKLTHSKILHFFKAIACGNEVTRGKPSPDLFVLAAQRLGVQPSRCLALEDSCAGVRAAASAQMRVIMVPDLVRPDPGIHHLGTPCVDSLKTVLIALTS